MSRTDPNSPPDADERPSQPRLKPISSDRIAALPKRYVVERELGRGGMGIVLLARDQKLRRDVALKMLTSGASADALARFEQEAHAAAALNHPNVLAVYDIGVTGDHPYIVSEVLDGQTLRERLQKGALPRHQALDYAVQLARGLEAAHARGIVHRDLKPENLFITKDGRLKILDFGIAKLPRAENTAETAEGAVLGTVGYMSPEQVHGEPVDARADIFSFGAILYEMLTGKPAFTRSNAVDSAHAILHEEPPSADPIVRRCIAKEAAKRYQTASELLAELQRPSRRARGLLWFALLIVTAAAAAALWSKLRRPPAAAIVGMRGSIAKSL